MRISKLTALIILLVGIVIFVTITGTSKLNDTVTIVLLCANIVATNIKADNKQK